MYVNNSELSIYRVDDYSKCPIYIVYYRTEDIQNRTHHVTNAR